jgi:AcrR family transcriptional regulator
MTAPAGLRERKKQQTREAIVRSALALFDERGFDATTIADIAAAADIAPRTFFGYFPSKEAVVFHDFEEVFGAFEGRVLQRRPDETAFDAMRAWIVGHLAACDPGADEDVRRRRLIRETPALRAYDRQNLARFETLLAEAVAGDLGTAPDALRPRLVSAAAIAAIEALVGFDDRDDAPTADEAVAVLDEVVVFLRGGLEALRAHPPTALG